MTDQPLRDTRGETDDLAVLRWGDRISSTEDQVPRRRAYERAHPDVTIRDPCMHDGMFTAELEGGAVEIRTVNLVLLLDELERRDRLNGP